MNSRTTVSNAVCINSTADAINYQPNLSSRQTDWQILTIERYHIPEKISTNRECYYADNVIIIQGQGLSSVSQKINGSLKTELVTNGDICIFPKDSPFFARAEKENDFLVLHLSDQLLQQACYALTAQLRFDLQSSINFIDPVLKQLSTLLMLEAESISPNGKLYVESLSQALALHLIKSHAKSIGNSERAQPTLSTSKLNNVIEYLILNLTNEVRLEQLASVAAMSPFHFARAFKKAVGIAPHQYLIKLRIEESMRLLIETDLTIAEIAYRLNFSSQSHLNRFFIKLNNLTPAKYRLIHKKR